VARGYGRRRRSAGEVQARIRDLRRQELDESLLDLNFLTPDKDSWTDGKATLMCLVLNPSHDQITRALRDAHE
jgi:hypothetical protein